MRVLITGSDGFIGRNLRLRLKEYADIEVRSFNRTQPPSILSKLLCGVDFVFHLAGVNRPETPQEFQDGNVELTRQLCLAIAQESDKTKKQIPVIFTSSIQALQDNSYGRSKREAETLLKELYSQDNGNGLLIFQLPNVFGKWCKPNYNSVVATFCHNIVRNLPVKIHNRDAEMQLVYIDDILNVFLQCLFGQSIGLNKDGYAEVEPKYLITVGELETLIRGFRESRKTLETEHVGTGFKRALYSTYVSYLPTEEFSYEVPKYEDPRGMFVEMLKTPDCGQFSFFTAHSGVTRGGHYHHTKTEKFLVIKGDALFRFRHMETDEMLELKTSGKQPRIVETIPGWAHDITNIGDEEMVVMLWANEKFDRKYPDTYPSLL